MLRNESARARRPRPRSMPGAGAFPSSVTAVALAGSSRSGLRSMSATCMIGLDSTSTAPPACECSAHQPRLAQIRLVDFHHELAVAHHEDAVADERELLRIERRDQHARPARRGSGDQLEDARLGTDVAALRGLIHEQDLWVVAQPFGEHDLLLIAAAEEREHALRIRWPQLDALHPALDL